MEKCNQSSEFDAMSKDKASILLSWIKQYILSHKYINNRYSSYGLKYMFENDTKHGFYITNGEFKGAMLASGYNPKNTLELNWNFRISRNSPCISLFSSV